MPAEELLGIKRGEIGQVQVRKVTVPNVVGVLWSKWPPGKVGAQSRSIWIAGGNAHANEMIRMYEDRSTFFFGRVSCQDGPLNGHSWWLLQASHSDRRGVKLP